jgi:hypothetical protein
MTTESITSPNDAAMLDWQKSGEEIFKRFVQNRKRDAVDAALPA